MAKPNFKKNNPNAILARDCKEPEVSNKNTSITMELVQVLPEPQQSKKKGQKYLRLDITDY